MVLRLLTQLSNFVGVASCVFRLWLDWWVPVLGLVVVGHELQTRPLDEEVRPECLRICKGLSQPYPFELTPLPLE